MLLLPLRQTAHCFSVLQSTGISWGSFSRLCLQAAVGPGSPSSAVPVPVFQCPAEGDFCAVGKCMRAIQGKVFGGCRKWWGEPGHTAGSDSPGDSVSSLPRGVCWGIRVSQGSDLAFVRKDGMFLVYFHMLVEVHFQGRALPCISFCASICCQQPKPFWIYMLDAAALM